MSKNNILIVDDDENIAELISLYLNKECYETEIAASGTEALQLFEEYSPDLVLLDVMLPGMDGYQVCTLPRVRYLTRCWGLRSVQMIISSSHLTPMSWWQGSAPFSEGQP